jgi:hypothetical protein
MNVAAPGFATMLANSAKNGDSSSRSPPRTMEFTLNRLVAFNANGEIKRELQDTKLSVGESALCFHLPAGKTFEVRYNQSDLSLQVSKIDLVRPQESGSVFRLRACVCVWG